MQIRLQVTEKFIPSTQKISQKDKYFAKIFQQYDALSLQQPSNNEKNVSETLLASETSVELSENQLFDFSISIAGRITKLHLDLHETVVLSDTVCTAE